MNTNESERPSTGSAAKNSRIAALDVIRGVALCGIIFVNIGPLTHFGDAVEYYRSPTFADATGWLYLFVQERFFPIFSLLFGIGFSIFLKSAARRTARPRLVLARRLLLLLVFGIAFNVLQPGAALAPYAIVGLVVLLPSTWLPRQVTALLTAVLIAGSLFAGGGLSLIPGLFLLGSCLTRFGLVAALGTSRQGSFIALIAFIALAVPLTMWHAANIEASGFSFESATAGLAVAGAYVALLSLLMTTKASGALEAAFAPLGKMALTNYVSAAPLMLAAGVLLDFVHSTSWTMVLTTAAGILLVQWVASTWWLGHFAQGPLEWLWRWGTWGHRQPLRRHNRYSHRVSQ